MSGIAAVLVVLYVLYMSYRDAYVRFPKNTRNAVVSGENEDRKDANLAGKIGR